MKKIILIALAFALSCNAFAAQDSNGKTSQTKNVSSAAALKHQSGDNGAISEDMSLFLSSLLKNTFVVLRIDYQLLNDNGYVITKDNKDYWDRVYSLGVRVGENGYLMTNACIQPWNAADNAIPAKYEAAVSQAAYRPIEAGGFEMFDFDPDGAEEVVTNRLYRFDASEEPGLDMVGVTGRTNGYAVWVVPESKLTEDNSAAEFDLVFDYMAFNINDGKALYTLPSEGMPNALGGLYLVPDRSRPGCVDLVIAGMFCKIGGVWKLIAIPDGTEVKYMSSLTPDILSETMDGMTVGMESFLSEIGL